MFSLECLSRRCFLLVVAFIVTIPLYASTNEAVAPSSLGGFDVRIDLVGNWPAVPERALEFEWTKYIGPLATQKALERLAAGEDKVWLPESDNVLPMAYASVVAANALFSPAVEAQRSSCRAFSKKANPVSPCVLGMDFAILGNGELACRVEQVEAWLASASNSTETSRRLSGDATAFRGANSRGGQTVVICGCTGASPMQPLPLLSWALNLNEAATASPSLHSELTVLFRQADCPAPPELDPAQRLAGFGVELRIKSTEYKATADDGETNPKVSTEIPKDVASDEDESEADLESAEVKALKSLEGVVVHGLHLDRLAARFESLAPHLLSFREQVEGEGLAEDLKRWELSDLGLQAAERVRRSPDPLATLETLTGSFPGLMAALAHDKVQTKQRRALERLRRDVHEGMRQIEIDGEVLAGQGLSLFEVLQHAREKIASLAQLGAGADMTATKIEKDNMTVASIGPIPSRLDWRSPSLPYVYHIRDDENAEDWAQRVGALASAPKRRTDEDQFDMFGMGFPPNTPKALAEIQQPLFTVIFAFDLMHNASLDFAVNITGTTRPLRTALVPVVDTTKSVEIQTASAAAAATYSSLIKKGKKKDVQNARAFLQALLKASAETPLARVGAALRDTKSGGKKSKDKKGSLSKANEEELQKAIKDGEKQRQAFDDYVRNKGLSIPCTVVNGLVLSGSSEESLVGDFRDALQQEEAFLRNGVLGKRLKDHKKSSEIDAALEGFILGAGQSVAVFDETLTPNLVFDPSASSLDTPDRFASEAMWDSSAKEFPTSSKPKSRPKLVRFPEDAFAQRPLLVSKKTSAGDSKLEVVLFITQANAIPLITAFATRLSSVEGAQLSVMLTPALEVEDAKFYKRVLSCLTSAKVLEDLTMEGWPDSSQCEDPGKNSELQLATKLWSALPSDDETLAARGAAIVCNGQLTADMPTAMPSSTASLVVEHRCPQAIPGIPAGLALAAAAIQSKARSAAFHSCESKTPRSLRVRLPRKNTLAPASMEVAAIIDPLWEGATAFAAIARLLHSQLNAEICIVLNPKSVVGEYPLKRWARYVVGWPSDKIAAPKEARGPLAAFDRLRTQHTLTVAVVSPPSWLVSARRSHHDLDNVRQMDAVHVRGTRPQITATYELERLYVEGSAHMASGNAAAGLQLELASSDGSVEDTRVMKNRGFWSMPALPGEYELRLKDGPSSETFELVDHNAAGSTVASRILEVTSYDAPVASLKVRTKAGAKEGDLFRKTFGKTKRSWRRRQRQQLSQDSSTAANTSLATIHIFSVASGHLYERLLAIMILSVRRHTQAPLHFWFVDNFLSPEFKDTLLPALVAEHGMGNTAYDLVTFKWPSWLNPQTDKQRLIWAYKILFLDVLFPMDVPRIIFIDADQVVRADVQELWNMDLQDSVYGFTPFCSGKTLPLGRYDVKSPPSDGLLVTSSIDPKSSELGRIQLGSVVNVLEVASAPVEKKIRARIDDPAGWISIGTSKGQEYAVAQSEGEERANIATRGFRFWESGYWKSHLGAKPYHISALFVVDLDEFRRRSVGDELRSSYNSLTMDPNGLANLDQDLPNYAQSTISIHSLPQEWLWCESWCSNASKPLAKTIDLCQNPQTKEPKIAMAKRIIPEWEGYHREVLALSMAKPTSIEGQDGAPDAKVPHTRSEL